MTGSLRSQLASLATRFARNSLRSQLAVRSLTSNSSSSSSPSSSSSSEPSNIPPSFAFVCFFSFFICVCTAGTSTGAKNPSSSISSSSSSSSSPSTPISSFPSLNPNNFFMEICGFVQINRSVFHRSNSLMNRNNVSLGVGESLKRATTVSEAIHNTTSSFQRLCSPLHSTSLHFTHPLF